MPLEFIIHLLTTWLNHVVVMKKKDENTEEQILEAAKHIFQSKGMDRDRMQEIADKAWINIAMLHYYYYYYYYRSKQFLFEVVFKNSFALLTPQLNTFLNEDSSIEEKVKNFTSDYITFIAKHPYLPNLTPYDIF